MPHYPPFGAFYPTPAAPHPALSLRPGGIAPYPFLPSVDTSSLAKTLRELETPSWYKGLAISAPPTEASSPLPWAELVEGEISLLSTGFSAPLPDAAALAQRLNSYNSQRGLFVTDIGRTFLRYVPHGNHSFSATLSLMIAAMRTKGAPFTRKANSMASAEKMHNHGGITKLLGLIDTALFTEDAIDLRRQWEGRAWADPNHSSLDLLDNLAELSHQCHKEDSDVLNRWSAAVHDAHSKNQFSVGLAELVNRFAFKMSSFSTIEAFRAALTRNTYHAVPLRELLPPSTYANPRHRSAGAVDSPSSVDSLAQQLAASLRTLASSAPAAAPPAAAPSVSFAPLPPPHTPLPPTGETDAAAALGTLKGGGVVQGFANIPAIQATGRLALLPAGSATPTWSSSSADGKFYLDCPFCGRGGTAQKDPPTEAYKSVKAYETQHKSPPFAPRDKPRPPRPILPTERIAHFSGRCPELWFGLRRHVVANPDDHWMMQPLSDDDFYSSIPENLRPRR